MYKILPIFLIFVIALVPIISAELIKNPREQLEEGILPENIICKENRVLVIRNNIDALCLKETTAQKLNFKIIKTFDSPEITNVQIFEEPNTEIKKEISNNDEYLSLDQIYDITQTFEGLKVDWDNKYDNVDFLKKISNDEPFSGSSLAGIPIVHYSALEYPEFIQVGDEFDVTVKWTFTEYDEEGNIEHQNIPLNTLTKEIFDETKLQIRIPENIEMVTDLSGWEETVKVYHDSSYNFNSTFTTYAKTVPFDYTDAMHEQTYRVILIEPFFPPFDQIIFGGLGFSKTIHHQDGSLIPTQLDDASINVIQSAITVERLGSTDPQYSEVTPAQVNWKRAQDITPMGINTPDDPDASQTQEIRDFYVNILNRNPTNEELLSTGVSQDWIDNLFETYLELK